MVEIEALFRAGDHLAWAQKNSPTTVLEMEEFLCCFNSSDDFISDYISV